jgi:hypothetical protein
MIMIYMPLIQRFTSNYLIAFCIANACHANHQLFSLYMSGNFKIVIFDTQSIFCNR